jgi:hypothetical protein
VIKAMSTVTFTAVPNGLVKSGDQRKWSLSVLVSPKLDVGDVPSILRAWPDQCEKLKFNVIVAKIDSATGKVKTESKSVVRPAQGLSPIPPPSFGTGLYRRLMENAASKGFAEQQVDPKTTFKTYDSEGVSKCLHRVASELFGARVYMQLLGTSPQPERYVSALDKLVREHVPFEMVSAGPPEVPAPQPPPTVAAVTPSAPLSASQFANITTNVVADLAMVRGNLAPTPPPAPVVPQAPVNFLESIRKGSSDQASFLGLLRDVSQRLLGTSSTAAAATQLQGALDEKADYTRRLYERDAFRIQNTAHEPLNGNAVEDVVRMAVRQTVGSVASEKLRNPLLDLVAFWQRLHRRGDSIAADFCSKADQEIPDFHKRWSLLGNYSALLPALGIVLKFEWIGAKEDQDFLASNQVLSVELPEGLSGLKLEFPWVSYSSNDFRPSSSDGSVQGGYLALSDAKHMLETADLDGGGQKLAQYFISLGRKRNQDPQALSTAGKDNADTLLPPTFRTAGITLVSKSRQDDVAKSFARSRTFDPVTDPLYAEDLVRGYVVDLWASKDMEHVGEWYSLCLRNETFAIPKERPLFARTGEGSVKPVTVEFNEKSEGQAPLAEMYVLQSLAHWNGAYLCVPAAQHATVPKDGTCVALRAPWELEAKMDVPSINGAPILQPPLRAGANYRVAVRVELLTGDIAPFDQNPASMLPNASTDPLKLKRYEPIGSPVVLLSENDCDPEAQKSVLDLVLRSKSAEDVTWSDATRIIAPPRTEERVARLHIEKERASGLMRGFRRLKIKSDDGSLMPVEPSVFDVPPKVPYLPDPLANEITGWLEDHIERKYYGPVRIPLSHGSRAAWPELLVHLLRFEALKQGSSPSFTTGRTTFVFSPGLSHDSLSLNVGLPPAHVATLTLQSGFGIDGKKNLEVMAWWERSLSLSPEMQTSEEAALRGDHPMLCSPVRLTLVHAVRVPIRDVHVQFHKRSDLFSGPTIPGTTRKLTQFVIARESGKSLVQVSLPIELDRKSTGKVRVSVKWSECRDNGNGSLQIATGNAIALDELIPNNASKPAAEEDDLKKSILQFDPSSTKFSPLTVSATAGSRFREQFPSESEEQCSRTGSPISVELLSCKPPDAPEILYLVPTFGWDDNGHDRPVVFRSKRQAAGVRVYLGSRWFSSGDDELLAVVIHQTEDVVSALQDLKKRSSVALYNAPQGGPDEQFVSSWGGDPIFRAQSMDQQLYLTGWDLPGCPPCPGGASPDEQGDNVGLGDPGGACGWNLPATGSSVGTLVAAVGYRPCFDKVRKLWYCDISFSRAPRYGVFVRLALARYQPHAIPGVELSDIAIPGFSQLNPDRTLIVQPKKIRAGKSDKNGIAVTIWGIPNPGGFGGGNEFQVSVERRAYKGTHSLGWEEVTVLPKLWPNNQNEKADAAILSGEQVLWYGEVLPDSCSERRIVVQEFESYESDDSQSTVTLSKRLVYADVVEIG